MLAFNTTSEKQAANSASLHPAAIIGAALIRMFVVGQKTVRAILKGHAVAGQRDGGFLLALTGRAAAGTDESQGLRAR